MRDEKSATKRSIPNGRNTWGDSEIGNSATKRSMPNGRNTLGMVRLEKVQLKSPYQLEETHGGR